MTFRYFEDFEIGEVIELGSCTVSESEVLEFANKFDPQSFHVDKEAAEKSIFGGLIASGWHTCSLMMRLMVDGLLKQTASLGSPGIDEIRWLLPVRPGDELHARYKVLELIPSKSKPDRGVVSCECEMTNQNGERVVFMRSKGMFGRKP